MNLTATIQFQAQCKLPTPWAIFDLYVFLESATGKEHLALVLGDLDSELPTTLRLHSECMTGDTLFSQRCDCGAQLEKSIQTIANLGSGILLYLRQEGRGIGLVNKIKAYALQDQGLDTVEANLHLGFQDDQRSYEFCKLILDYFGITKVALMSNNPRKISALKAMNLEVTRLSLEIPENDFNRHYLLTKVIKLGHLLEHPKLP